ncbi:hypothetical protein MAJ_11525, partial [Metarhizium majus ARSEF 297]
MGRVPLCRYWVDAQWVLERWAEPDCVVEAALGCLQASSGIRQWVQSQESVHGGHLYRMLFRMGTDGNGVTEEQRYRLAVGPVDCAELGQLMKGSYVTSFRCCRECMQWSRARWRDYGESAGKATEKDIDEEWPEEQVESLRLFDACWSDDV